METYFLSLKKYILLDLTVLVQDQDRLVDKWGTEYSLRMVVCAVY